MIPSALNLRKRRAMRYLRQAADGLREYGGRHISVDFTDAMAVGGAAVDNHGMNFSDIQVGIVGLSHKHDFGFSPVSDLQFTRAFVALFHEYGHYLQNYGPMKHIETSVSEASVVGNKAYYISNWNRLPHEIAAEMAGVSLSWDAMSSMFPEQADGCMLEYVNFRARNTAYMLPVKDGGYASREEIEDSFALSLESSLSEPRRGDSGLQRMSNEAAALLKQGHANYKLSPNGRHFDMLISDVPGSKKDRLLAALAIHLHPDILDDHPELQDEDLTVEHEFGFPLAVETLPGPDMKSGPITELEQSVSKTDEREAETIRRRMFAERMDKGF